MKRILCIALLLTSNVCLADQLSQVKQKINDVKSNIAQDEGKSEELNQQLKATEKSIGVIAKRLTDIQKLIDEQHNKLSALEKKLNTNQKKLQIQRQIFSEQLQSHYIMSGQGQLGIYFSDNNPDDIGRYANYYRALDQAQLNSIDNLQKNIDSYNKTAHAIRQNTEHLQQLYREQQSKQKQTLADQQQRKKIVNSLNTNLERNNQQLQQLSKNQKTLTTVVSQLTPTPSYGSFKQARGKLHWPTQGSLLVYYGKRTISGTSQGDIISAKLNTPVKAIYGGKVIYADWLRGYGLLLIIDHGNGYMSLYGRNNSLYAKVGESIGAGETIATVGRSGGFETPALYFEIRHDGNAIPTSGWFTSPRPAKR